MLRVEGTWTAPQGAPYFTTLHFTGAGATDAADAHDRVVVLFTSLAARFSNAYAITVLSEVAEVDPATGQTTDVHAVPAVTVNGTSSSQPLPFTTQGLLRWTTGFFQAGRQIRGRTFLPGVVEDDTQGGSPTAAVVNTVSGLLAAWLTNNEPLNQLAIYSRTGNTVTAVSDGTMWAQWAVLRSRRD